MTKQKVLVDCSRFHLARGRGGASGWPRLERKSRPVSSVTTSAGSANVSNYLVGAGIAMPTSVSTLAISCVAHGSARPHVKVRARATTLSALGPRAPRAVQGEAISLWIPAARPIVVLAIGAIVGEVGCTDGSGDSSAMSSPCAAHRRQP